MRSHARPNLSRCERGLTLPELLVALAVVIVTAAVLLPHLGDMKTRAYNAQALSNLKMLAKAEVRRRMAEGAFAACESSAACVATFPELRVSPGIAISAVVQDDGFVAFASHANGDERYVWDSLNGGLQAAEGGGGDPPEPPGDDPGEPGKPPKPGKPDKPGKPGNPGKPGKPGKPGNGRGRG